MHGDLNVSKPVWHIPLLCVQWKTPDDGQRNCPKHVEFYSKNKFEKSVHLVGLIKRIFPMHYGEQIKTGYLQVKDVLEDLVIERNVKRALNSVWLRGLHWTGPVEVSCQGANKHSESVAQLGYGLDIPGFRIPAGRQEDFTFFKTVQTESGAHPISYSKCNGITCLPWPRH